MSSTHPSAAAILKKCTFVQQNVLLLVPHALEHGSTLYKGMAICRTGVHVKSTSQHHLRESSHLISTHEKNSLAVFSLTPQIVKNHSQILRNDQKTRKEWSNQFQFHTGRINILKIKVSMYFWPPSTYCCAHLLAHAWLCARTGWLSISEPTHHEPMWKCAVLAVHKRFPKQGSTRVYKWKIARELKSLFLLRPCRCLAGLRGLTGSSWEKEQ